MKAPAFQLYAGDFLVGTAMMSAEEVGGYIRLLCYQWTEGSLPDDDAVLMRLAGCGGNAIASIRHKFGIGPAGRLANAKLEEVRQEQEAYRAKQADNAHRGWEKRRKTKVGNATAHATAMPPHMPEACSSVFSLQSSNNTNCAQGAVEAPKTKKQAKVRERNPVMDALATVAGGNPEEVTPALWGRTAKALADIRTVCPDVTADEIRRRAANYKTHYPDAALTPNALANHWALANSMKAQPAGNMHRDTYGRDNQIRGYEDLDLNALSK